MLWRRWSLVLQGEELFLQVHDETTMMKTCFCNVQRGVMFYLGFGFCYDRVGKRHLENTLEEVSGGWFLLIMPRRRAQNIDGKHLELAHKCVYNCTDVAHKLLPRWCHCRNACDPLNYTS